MFFQESNLWQKSTFPVKDWLDEKVERGKAKRYLGKGGKITGLFLKIGYHMSYSSKQTQNISSSSLLTNSNFCNCSQDMLQQQKKSLIVKMWVFFGVGCSIQLPLFFRNIFFHQVVVPSSFQVRPGFELMSKDHGLDRESSTFTTRPGGFPIVKMLVEALIENVSLATE